MPIISNTGNKIIKTEVDYTDNQLLKGCINKASINRCIRAMDAPCQIIEKKANPDRIWNMGQYSMLLTYSDDGFNERIITLKEHHNAICVHMAYVYTGTSTIAIHNEQGNLLRVWGYSDTFGLEALISEHDLNQHDSCLTSRYTDIGNGERVVFMKPLIVAACSFKNILLDYYGYINSNNVVAAQIKMVKLYAQPCNIDYKNNSLL